MNEIKLVIQDLKYLISDECTNTQCDYIEEIEIALQALQEKAEREKGCERCSETRPYPNVCSPAENQRFQNAKFCKYCGRKLEAKQ